MKSRALFTAFLIATFCSSSFAQKIKYKDLFILLNAKQFTEAEPFLRKYLKDNDDNPNAYLFMGMIHQERASKMDILKQTEQMTGQLDSAVLFYEKASKGMTEKEVSKNEEYYQMYNRRDLRTGKFGVKLSDVQLDLETRIKLKDRVKLIKTLKLQFVAAEKSYQRAQQFFLEIQKSYPGNKEFFLRSDEQLITKLNHVAQVYDSCHISFNDYKATSASLGKTGYNQDLDPMEIMDFKKDGVSPSDFYHDDLKVWDFKRWALSSIERMEKDFKPLQEQLVARDAELNKLQLRIKQDSVSVSKEAATISNTTFAALLKIDPSPLPLRVFDMKQAELSYGSMVVEHKPLKDSINIMKQVEALKKEVAAANLVDSLAGALTLVKLEEESENYKHFVTTAYGTSSVLSSLISSTREFGVREKTKKEDMIKRKNEMLRWIVDGTDSIPLFADPAISKKFKPLILQEEKFTAGLKYADSLSSAGYFYVITPSRKAGVKANFNVDQPAFPRRNIAASKALYAHDDKGQLFYVVFYSENKIKEKYPATIVKIYRTDGVAWSVNHLFDQVPFEVTFSLETSTVTVKTKNSAGELTVVTFDKAGKIVK